MRQKIAFTTLMLLAWPFIVATLLLMAISYGTVGIVSAILGEWQR